MIFKFFSKNLWIPVTAGIAGLGGVTSYYTVDYFTHWGTKEIDKHFSKMLELYSHYIDLVSSKRESASSVSQPSSEGTQKTATSVPKDVSDAAKEVWKLYNEIFIPGIYYKLPEGVKAFGLLRILTMKRSAIFKNILASLSSSSSSSTSSGKSEKKFSKEDLHNVDEEILKQIEIIYDNFDQIPKSVIKFFSFILDVFPYSGVEFLDKDKEVIFPAFYLLNLSRYENKGEEEEDSYWETKISFFKRKFLKLFVKGKRILKEVDIRKSQEKISE